MVSKNEICFLQKYSNKKIKVINNEKALYKTIRQSIINTVLASAKNYPETSFSCYTKINSPFVASYSYQRYDLYLDRTDWLNYLYNFSDIDNKAFGLLTSSGMSAINLLITVLNKLKVEKNIIITKYPYFEVFHLIDNFFSYFEIIEIERNSYEENGILWIDSSSSKVLDIKYKKNHDIVVIDTSCFEPGSKVLKDLILKFKDNSVIVLIRSHIKLDCFGLEISRLGSLTFIFPSKDEENFELADSIAKDCKYLIACNGGNIEIKNIYPWLGQKEFFDLTATRTNNIRNFCIEMEECIKNRLDVNKYSLRVNDHKMYFSIIFLTGAKKYYNSYDYGDLLAKKAEKLGLPVRNSSSFGLNLVAFDEYPVEADNNRRHLRISSSDLPLEKAKLIIDFLLEELSKDDDE